MDLIVDTTTFRSKYTKEEEKQADCDLCFSLDMSQQIEKR